MVSRNPPQFPLMAFLILRGTCSPTSSKPVFLAVLGPCGGRDGLESEGPDPGEQLL